MFVIHKRAPTYVLTLFHIQLISINIIYLVMSILLCTFVSRKERDTNCQTFKLLSIMKNLEFTQEELVIVSALIEDIGRLGEDGATGGMYTGNIYMTPTTCRCCAKVIEKINEYLYDNPTTYKEAYDRLKENSVNK